MQRENDTKDYREDKETNEVAQKIAGRLESWNDSMCPPDSKESRSAGKF
jgi:hypothetical protein